MKYSMLLLFVVALFSCNDDELRFDSAEYFDVKDVIQSSNCAADCEEVADCEGVDVKLAGLIDEANINAANNFFYIVDEDDQLFSMEVIVEEAISESVFSKVTGNGGKSVRLEGVLEGVDDESNIICERRIFVNLTDPSAIRIIE